MKRCYTCNGTTDDPDRDRWGKTNVPMIGPWYSLPVVWTYFCEPCWNKRWGLNQDEAQDVDRNA